MNTPPQSSIIPGQTPPANTTLAQMIAAMNASAPLGTVTKLAVNAAGVPAWK